MASRLFERLKAGLEEGVAFEEGHLDLRTTVIPSPPPAVRPKQIVAARRRLNMTQIAFARLLNVSLSTLRRWERGEGRPTSASLRILQIAAEKPEVLRDLAGVGPV
jgi:putative transcriptional regulator